MIALLFGLLGGVGLFLLGMSLLTDGLKSFAGDNLRIALLRFTDNPYKACASGALVTALVQSSSATTVTVIGFVSAGLLTFSSAVGVVLGASLGTTATGWLVSLLGLKVSVGFYALPFVGVGSFMRLFGRGRCRALGLSLAGFGIIFIGIETLQISMTGLSGQFNLQELPVSGVMGHVVAMLFGLLMTVVMQSSSAAVATTLTALHTNSIAFDQAASLVIGAAIGTTVTGAIAAIGGSIPAKRTALAHVLFNTATGIIAITLLPVFLRLIAFAQDRFGLDPGAVSLAAFHTLFIVTGVIVFLPFIDRFSGRIERLLPEKAGRLTANLDDSQLSLPVIAMETVRQALKQIGAAYLDLVRDLMTRTAVSVLDEVGPESVRKELSATQKFFARIPPVSDDRPLSELRVSLIHALDHLVRMEEYVFPPAVLRQSLRHAEMTTMLTMCREMLDTAEQGLNESAEPGWALQMARQTNGLMNLSEERRAALIRMAAAGGLPSDAATGLLDAVRWLVRVGNHMARAAIYLHQHADQPDDAESSFRAPPKAPNDRAEDGL